MSTTHFSPIIKPRPSVKLPRLANRIIGGAESRQKIKVHDISLVLIKAQESVGQNSPRENHNNRYKKKSQSRAQPNRMKTESVNRGSEVTTKIEEADGTMKDFQKNIEENRKKLVNRRAWINGGNKSSMGSIKNTDCSQEKKKSSTKKQRCVDAGIFHKLNKILSKTKIVSAQIDLGQVQKTLKYAEIAKKLLKFKSGNQENDLSLSIKANAQDKLELKNEENYCQWRRLNLSGEKEPQYSASNLETEDERIKKLIQKTEVTLSKYWQSKNLADQMRNVEGQQ